MTDKIKHETVTFKLPKEVFSVDVKNHELLKLAYSSYLANSRNAHPKSKDRGDVSGGGKKPWRQKGTGRARFGSSRNPIWRGGGVAFGPQGNENHTIRISKNAKRTALRQALSLANSDNKIVVADELNLSSGKTKDAIALLNKYGIANKRRILAVVGKKTTETVRATNNLENVKLISAMYLNVFDILNADAIIFGRSGLDQVITWLKNAEVK